MTHEFMEAASEEVFVEQSTAVLRKHIARAIASRGACILGLSGGSTPRPIYEALGKEKGIDWARVWIFLVDERSVPPDHPESNQRLVRETLLKNAPIPKENLVFPDTTLPIEECIQKYARALRNLWKDYLPDVVTLGMGDDGHTASLFPPLSDDALSDRFLVLHTITDRFAIRDRITLALNPIAAAGTQIFFLKGNEKKKVWEEMLASAEDERRWPAKRILQSGRAIVATLW